MCFSDNVSKFRLPLHATMEELECNWSKVIRYGNVVIVAGYYYNGIGNPCYFSAFYMPSSADDDFTCETPLDCKWCSDVEFEDDGHAIVGAIKHM
jgi:hypothetical protein